MIAVVVIMANAKRRTNATVIPTQQQEQHGQAVIGIANVIAVVASMAYAESRTNAKVISIQQQQEHQRQAAIGIANVIAAVVIMAYAKSRTNAIIISIQQQPHGKAVYRTMDAIAAVARITCAKSRTIVTIRQV